MLEPELMRDDDEGCRWVMTKEVGVPCYATGLGGEMCVCVGVWAQMEAGLGKERRGLGRDRGASDGGFWQRKRCSGQR